MKSVFELSDNIIIQEMIKDSYNLNGPTVDGEYKVMTAEGKSRMWKFNSANIGKIADGRKVSMTAVMDITDRRVTEQASDVISVLNITKGKFTYISPAMFYLRGFIYSRRSYV